MITINLGIDNSPYVSQEDILQFFELFFIIDKSTLNFRFKYSTYVANNKTIKEKTAVFNVYTRYYDDLTDVDNNIKKLCSIFNQDCIAYYHNSAVDKLNFGKLIYNIKHKGQKETFNLNYFIQ